MKIQARTGLAAAFVTMLGCGSLDEQAPVGRADRPIIGGEESKEGHFPTVVGLLLDAMAPDLLAGRCMKGKGVCTASLIREDVILTAAHCVSNLLKDNPLIMCPGDPDPPEYTFDPDLIAAAKGGKMVKTRKVVVHPEFAPARWMCMDPPDVDRWNDIAIVFLDKPLKGAPLMRIAKPDEAMALLKQGDKVRIVGYGKSRVDDAMGMTAGRQRHGLATLMRVGPTELRVAKMGEQQACQGDSGGPVIANPDAPAADQVQIGVASRLHTPRCPQIWDLFNPPKCENGVMYTRVDAYHEWIVKTIEKERPEPPKEDPPKDPPKEDPPKEDPPKDPGPEPMDPINPEGPGAPGMDEAGCRCATGRGNATGGTPLMPLLIALVGLRLRLRRR